VPSVRGIHWFRNDLRLQDNTALAALAERVEEWLPLFVLDPRIFSRMNSGQPRVRFLLECLDRLGEELANRGLPLLIRKGRPERVLPKLCQETGAGILAFNEDTTPFAIRRDAAVTRAMAKAGVKVLARSDRVVYRSREIRSLGGGPYSIYSPYRKTWWRRWSEAPRLSGPACRLPRTIAGFSRDPIPFAGAPKPGSAEGGALPTGGAAAGRRRLDRFLQSAVGAYDRDRDIPGLDGTSRLSPYLRFGAISVRQCFERALGAAAEDSRLEKGVSKWLDELIWRDFYSGILEEHPRVLRQNFRSEYDSLEWNEDTEGFEAWCQGRTGFPIVDAGMRQLASTGWMHNRIRMVVASFLTKDLLVDWRQGERFFFDQLVDGDPASNSGGWQWAASTGTDAQPYFRIFNPTAQGQRWDPGGRYVRRWVQELRDVPDRYIHTPHAGAPPAGYPPPSVDHAKRRKVALERFRHARSIGARK
jgi:deoxyribodipyrimidine photo-lyase